MITVTRYHDFSAGHRVVNHESKCAFLHGHNYRIHFTLASKDLDEIGRVIDFGVIKSILCEWLEIEWDHKMLIWSKDPHLEALKALEPSSVVEVDFNPTAENMAQYIVEEIAPKLLPEDVQLIKITIDETRKCSATYQVSGQRGI